MALTAQPPAPAGWSRWPQHHPNGEYQDVMMDPNIMPYDSRPATSAPLQRPLVAHNFFPTPPYTHASIPPMSAPQYLPGLPPVTYGGYASFTTSPILGSPFKHEQYHERPQLRVISPVSEGGRGFRQPRDSSSPSVKSEPRAMSVSSQHSASPASPRGAQEVVFNTKVDALMKAIQSKNELDEARELCKAEPEPVVQNRDMRMDMLSQRPLPPVPQQRHQVPQAVASPSTTQLRNSKLKTKRYACEFPDCGKFFSQKTHLDTHTRSHTGEEPYVCSFGCGKRFTQLGNQKIHERRHTGEKPYKCTICDKRFTQHGTLMAHRISHTKAKPFACKLDNCNKKFTQRGNLKSHQNKFHSTTLEALINKFATVKPSEVSDEDKELWAYFADLYKNSNKGIKGRGKHHKVKLLPQLSATSSMLPHSHAPPYHGLPQILNTPQPFYQSLPPHGMFNIASYGRGRTHHYSNGRDSQYDMFETEDDSVTGSGASSTAYEDDHHREMAFSDRMY
ncbi:putative C2H2 transcription factor [Rhypophila decipiens]|uniref:C2H2 transcription factor n=1 Tax=Rhypophila decipiens TaxID=261697 RepID=A0AAN6YI35_9PEZI|nr:putative C2H2 transcription factor [Rhypophila decipiens]